MQNESLLPSELRGLKKARPSLDYANEYCRRATYSHYENFPVASFLVPKRLRQHVCNIYTFSRMADDFADEAKYEGRRDELLNEWELELKLAYQHQSIHPVFVALEQTIMQFGLPEKLFLDLIKAFKMDVHKRRYKNFDEVLYYCQHSANPVGRLILLLFGFQSEEWFAWSDKICTGLQLANFWQDVAVDLKKDRIYIPAEEMVVMHVTEYDLEDRNLTDSLVSLMKAQVERAEKIFLEGKPLCRAVSNMRLSFELKLTWLGGMAILNKIRSNGYNVFERPVIGKLDKIKLLFKALFAF